MKRFDWLLLTLLVLIRVPYYWTRHIQEDAFISFRCAMTLADTGTYGFNLLERVSAATSHLYVFLLAMLRLFTGDYFILAAQLAGTVILVLAVRMLVRLLTTEPWGRLLWVLASLLPPALVISYCGMETPLVILAIAAILTVWQQEYDGWKLAALLFLLPWVRPELTALGFLLGFVAWSQWRRLAWRGLLGLVTGVGALFLFNQLYFGEPLNHTITAKMVQMHPSHSIAGVAVNIRDAFHNLYLPVGTKHTEPFGLFFMGAVLCAQMLGLRFLRKAPGAATLRTFVLVALALPLAYGIGGVVFAWYLWPWTLLGEIALLYILLSAFRQLPRPRLVVIGAVVLPVLLLAAAQWMVSVGWGAKERRYRAEIGMQLRNMIPPGGSLMLEPIGYIPFFAQRYTHCEIGLASPTVTDYRRKFGNNWFGMYIQDFRPTHLLQKVDPQTGEFDEITTAAQRDWLHAHYRLVKTFSYDPVRISRSPLILAIIRHTSACVYYLYEYHADQAAGALLVPGRRSSRES
ncbi:MAG: hypothetical protein ACOYOU_21015 [Kiritimatiellia bacterium]